MKIKILSKMNVTPSHKTAFKQFKNRFHCFVAKKRSVRSGGVMITMIMILIMRGGIGGRGARRYNDNDNDSMTTKIIMIT